MYREQVHHDDRSLIFALLSASGQFSTREIAHAINLFDLHNLRLTDSPYHFLLQEKDTELHTCCCFAPMPLSDSRYQLHWLVVDQNYRKAGLGRMLEHAVEDKVRKLGGKRLFAEASNADRHESLRHFYENCGYHLAAVVPDFYADGEHKVWYTKAL